LNVVCIILDVYSEWASSFWTIRSFKLPVVPLPFPCVGIKCLRLLTLVSVCFIPTGPPFTLSSWAATTDRLRDTHTHLYGCEDAGEGPRKQQEDRNGRQLAGVSVAEVSDRLDQLRREDEVRVQLYNLFHVSEVTGHGR